MHHTGTLFMSKQRPIVETDSAGAFRLELVLVDNQGRNVHTGKDIKEAYRVQWTGPEAQAFWTAHKDAMTAGAPLHAELERLRARLGPQSYPPMPELHGRVLRLQLLPRRAHHPADATTQPAAAAA